MNLYAHQKKIVDLLPHKHLLAHGLGTGKTITALALARRVNLGTLIICPKMLKPKWEREANSWLVNTEYGLMTRGDYVVLSKEEFKKHFKTLPRFQAIIVDEAHNTFGSLKSQGHKALYAYIKVHNPTYVWLLTGTPYTSTPMSVFALGRLLGAPWKWMDFRDQYFRERYIGRRVIFEPRPGIEAAIAERVKEIGSVVRLDECIDVPPQTFEEEEFAWTSDQLKALKELKERESNPLTRFTKAHQIAQGILIGDEYRPDQFFKCLKNDRVVELAEQNEKLIVFSRYNLHLEHLSDMLNEKGILNVVINGATKNREALINTSNAAKRVILLVQADCSEGWEAPSFGVVVHACLGYSYVKYNQSLGRVLRINAPKPNYYLTLTTKDSADMLVSEAMRKKESFHDAIFLRNNPNYI